MTEKNQQIDQLLGLAFEVEGLLMLARRREDMTPAEIYKMLTDKSRSLLDGIEALDEADTIEEPVVPAEGETTAESTPVEEPETQSETEATYGTEAVIVTEPGPEVLEETETESEIVAEPQTEPFFETEPSFEPEPEPYVEPEPSFEPEPEPYVEPEPSFEPEPYVEPEPEPAYEPEPTYEPEPVAKPESPAIALTLNDKFRFSRALFGGSDARLADALTEIAAITDSDDLDDYLINDLCLDPENSEDAKDFIALIKGNI